MRKQLFSVDGIEIEIERKRVKNVNFTVYAPDGRVRVSAPLHMPAEKLQHVISARLPWIKRHRERILNQKRLNPLKYISGEVHPYLGKMYTLRLIEHQGRAEVETGPGRVITMYVRKGSSIEQRAKVLMEWYRAQLKALIPAIIARWEPVIGVKVSEWNVKRMKTRWGSCNTTARRIWLNLELIKHPQSALEYIVVHEMVHLLERHHNKRFYAYMDGFLPGWREVRKTLKQAALNPSSDW